MLNPALAAAVHSLATVPQMASSQHSTLSAEGQQKRGGDRFNVAINVVRAVGLHPKLGDTSL